MSLHLQREIANLKKQLLTMSAMVQEIIIRAVRALNERDTRLADRVIQSDNEIDRLELDIEEDCLKILALYNPVAQDLRFVVAVLKINNDLERMADQAVNIAERAKTLATREKIEIPSDLTKLADISLQMLKDALQALIKLDTDLAAAVIKMDDQADDIHRQMYQLVQQKMRENPEQIECQINIISISRNLERIADQITNIAEDVIYLVKGDIIRHSYQND
ncbi:MAG: phosphate signaling complex protein PhoU [bacterium]|nr:phosphate signaling complex protein PhoU [bacterium]